MSFAVKYCINDFTCDKNKKYVKFGIKNKNVKYIL